MSVAQQGWPLPDRRTVKARVDQIEKRLTARKRRDLVAVKATTPVPGQYEASRPLEVIQIDHTFVDLNDEVRFARNLKEALMRLWSGVASLAPSSLSDLRRRGAG
jgi:hypothetical protein